MRTGITIMDSVEVFNCSQYDTLKAAFRFDGAAGGYSSITNSSLDNGWGQGITILGSKNIFIQNTNLFSFLRFGIFIDSSFNITLDGNLVVGVWERGLIALDKFVDVGAGIAGCGFSPLIPCSYSITNNIVAGAL
jgi:hypothetical protein